jgi:hypothetical protein
MTGLAQNNNNEINMLWVDSKNIIQQQPKANKNTKSEPSSKSATF